MPSGTTVYTVNVLNVESWHLFPAQFLVSALQIYLQSVEGCCRFYTVLPMISNNYKVWSDSFSAHFNLQGVWCCYPAHVNTQYVHPLCGACALRLCHLCEDSAGPCWSKTLFFLLIHTMLIKLLINNLTDVLSQAFTLDILKVRPP